ncbi:hypothetical protein QE357_002234 [Siphonobacter sp. BAB-5404]|nr:hypothetical protein [Siphonobacter sp. SORGH_AS_0500]
MEVNLPLLSRYLSEAEIEPKKLIEVLNTYCGDLVNLVAVDYPPYDYPLEYLECKRHQDTIEVFIETLKRLSHDRSRTEAPTDDGESELPVEADGSPKRQSERRRRSRSEADL